MEQPMFIQSAEQQAHGNSAASLMRNMSAVGVTVLQTKKTSYRYIILEKFGKIKKQLAESNMSLAVWAAVTSAFLGFEKCLSFVVEKYQLGSRHPTGDNNNSEKLGVCCVCCGIPQVSWRTMFAGSTYLPVSKPFAAPPMTQDLSDPNLNNKT